MLTAVFSLNYWYKKNYTQSLQLFLSVAIAFIACFILKYTIHYPRPEHVAHLLGNQSLPSGHSCLVTAFMLNFRVPKTAPGWRKHLSIPVL